MKMWNIAHGEGRSDKMRLLAGRRSSAQLQGRSANISDRAGPRALPSRVPPLSSRPGPKNPELRLRLYWRIVRGYKKPLCSR
jgi:hypothetical protein